MDNTQLVFRMYELFGKGDMEGIKREVFHPDMSWTMPGHHPLSARMEGVDAVIAFFGSLFKAGIVVDNVHFGVLDDGTDEAVGVVGDRLELLGALGAVADALFQALHDDLIELVGNVEIGTTLAHRHRNLALRLACR